MVFNQSLPAMAGLQTLYQQLCTYFSPVIKYSRLHTLVQKAIFICYFAINTPAMKLLFTTLLIVTNIFNHHTSEDVLAKMHARYAGKWMKSFSFTQTTEQYRNDSLINTSTWYENVVFPGNFRIDFGDKTSGNAAIFVNDSVYRFGNAKLVKVTVNDDDLTFLLGGMFFYPLDMVKAKLQRMGYDVSKGYETSLDNKPVYVIGANNADEATSQLWIDKEKLILVKFINFKDGEKEEGVAYDHKQFGNSWSETSFDFYVNGKIIQKEKYYDCKADVNIDHKIFDPHKFISIK